RRPVRRLGSARLRSWHGRDAPAGACQEAGQPLNLADCPFFSSSGGEKRPAARALVRVWHGGCTGGPAFLDQIVAVLNWSTNRRQMHAICRLAVGVGATARLAGREGRIAAAHRSAFAAPAVGRRIRPWLEAAAGGEAGRAEAAGAWAVDRGCGVRPRGAGRLGARFDAGDPPAPAAAGGGRDRGQGAGG